jgi:hypothetical protein
MERDDRLFAVIGSCVAIGTAVIVWLVGFTPLGPPDADVQASVPAVSAAQQAVEVGSTTQQEPVVVPAVHRPDLVDDRDGLVRAAARRMTRHPEVLGWLMTDDLSNRIVESVDAVADGRIPRDHAAVVATDRPFLVYESDRGFAVAAGTSRRFDLVVDALTSVDPRDAAAMLAEIAPDLEAAWTDRGGPGWFEERLRAAVDHLLEVRVPSGALEVERRARHYEWADDDLRLASPAQKALLRTGGNNARAIQAWLDALRLEMGWPSRPQQLAVQVAEATPEGIDAAPGPSGEITSADADGVAAGAR